MPHQLLRQKSDDRVVPWCTYTDPEIARVGLNEVEAKNSGVAYDLLEQPMKSLDRAVVEDATSGFARVLVRKGTDEILGATYVGEGAGDLLQPIV
jgi:pyruvate/2-oxoglutarate dehydrogenase complex dihydrolipoamide dehydrogenase (E3) component